RTRFVVITSRRYDRNIHSAGLIDLIKIDLREDQLFANAERIVAAAIERFTRNAAKVSHTRKRYGDQAIEELEHTVASKRDHRSDAHSLSKLESCDRLLRLGHNGLLASDRFQLFG